MADVSAELLASFRTGSVHWEEFLDTANRITKSHRKIIQKLRFVLADSTGKFVKRDDVARFLQWYTPLKQETDVSPIMIDVADMLRVKNYTVTQVAQLLSNPFFHGWLSYEKAEVLLKNQADGTFLFRFSSTPQSYTLDVAYKGQVVHWRITTTENYQLSIKDHQDYPSFEGIVASHNAEGSALKAGNHSIFLLNGAPRENLNQSKTTQEDW